MISTKVIYIAGQSYSGSTFLCALLGIHPQMVPVSEAAMLTNNKNETKDRFCACGRLSRECPFWLEVRKRWSDNTSQLTAQNYSKLQNKFETLSHTWPQIFLNKLRPHSEFEVYAKTTVQLYERISEVSGRPIIVDSSKNPARAVAISKMEGLEVFVIHLVRNGLNYLNSNLSRRKISIDEPNLFYKIFRLGTRWSVTNYAAEQAMRINRPRGMRLRYEDLITNPAQSLELVGKVLNINMSSVQDHIVSQKPVSYQHMASGSHHRRAAAKTISSEYNSISNLDWRLRLPFYLGAAVISRRYGYL